MSGAGAGDTLTVRPATHTDLPGIQSVAEQTWPATYAGQIPQADIEAFLAAHYSPERLMQQSQDRYNPLSA